MSDKFTPLGNSEIVSLLRACSENLPPGFKDEQKLEAMARPLSFYPDSRLIELKLKNRSGSMPVCIFASAKGTYHLLDWQPKTIYLLNEKENFSISFGNVVEYLKFFFRYTQSPEGRFMIVEGPEELNWREEPPLAVRKSLSSMIQPTTLNMWDEEQKKFQISTHFLFQNHLFEANVDIDHRGYIQVIERVLKVENIPLLDNITGQ